MPLQPYDALVARVEKGSEWEREALIPFLLFEEAQRFLTASTTREEWHQIRYLPTSIESVMRTYAAFTWEAIQSEHGPHAAVRGATKIAAWGWLLGYDMAFLAAVPSPLDRLVLLCAFFDFPMPYGAHADSRTE
jgi:hypothetical protein